MLYEKDCDYKYSFNKQIIVKLINENDWSKGFEYVTGCTSELICRDNYLKVEDLEPGVYYHYIEIQWEDGTEKYNPQFEFTANCYGISHISYLTDESN